MLSTMVRYAAESTPSDPLHISVSTRILPQTQSQGRANLLVDGVEGSEQPPVLTPLSATATLKTCTNCVLRFITRIEGCTAIRDDKVTIMIGFRSVSVSRSTRSRTGGDDVAAQSKILSVGAYSRAINPSCQSPHGDVRQRFGTRSHPWVELNSPSASAAVSKSWNDDGGAHTQRIDRLLRGLAIGVLEVAFAKTQSRGVIAVIAVHQLLSVPRTSRARMKRLTRVLQSFGGGPAR